MPKPAVSSNVKFSAEYNQRMSTKTFIQNYIHDLIMSGRVTNQDDLNKVLDDINWSLDSIKMIPFETAVSSFSKIK